MRRYICNPRNYNIRLAFRVSLFRYRPKDNTNINPRPQYLKENPVFALLYKFHIIANKKPIL